VHQVQKRESKGWPSRTGMVMGSLLNRADGASGNDRVHAVNQFRQEGSTVDPVRDRLATQPHHELT